MVELLITVVSRYNIRLIINSYEFLTIVIDTYLKNETSDDIRIILNTMLVCKVIMCNDNCASSILLTIIIEDVFIK